MLPPIVTLFAALLWSSRVPNLYESDMLIAIDPQRVPDNFVRSTVTLGTELRMDAISVQVMSRTSLERIIEKPSISILNSVRFCRSRTSSALMRKNIFVELERSQGREGGPHAFHVRFTHPDPRIAAEVTQQLGSLYVAQNVQDRSARAESTNRFLETQLADARQRLEIQESRLEAFRQRHGKELPTQMQTNMQANMNAQMQLQSMNESLARDRDRKQMLERLYNDAVETPLPAAPMPAGQPPRRERDRGCRGVHFAAAGNRARDTREPRTPLQTRSSGHSANQASDCDSRSTGRRGSRGRHTGSSGVAHPTPKSDGANGWGR